MKTTYQFRTDLLKELKNQANDLHYGLNFTEYVKLLSSVH